MMTSGFYHGTPPRKHLLFSFLPVSPDGQPHKNKGLFFRSLAVTLLSNEGNGDAMKNVKEILAAKGPEIWSISTNAKVFEALKLMADKKIGALIVMEDKGQVEGIITERDYARKVILFGKASKETFVGEIMTPADKMYSVRPDTTVEECMVLMTAKHVRHLPVFDGDKFTGVLSIGDVVKAIISEKDVLIEHLSNYISGKYM
jgi:CBS domain-containing protein